MVYGHYITDTAGNERFFVEGCNYCQMSTGGQHGAKCPLKDIRVTDKQEKLDKIRAGSYSKYGEAWLELAQL